MPHWTTANPSLQLLSQAKPPGSEELLNSACVLSGLGGQLGFCVISALIPLQKVPAEERVAFSILVLEIW